MSGLSIVVEDAGEDTAQKGGPSEVIAVAILSNTVRSDRASASAPPQETGLAGGAAALSA